MSVVFDTNVIISSTLWEGSVAQKLLFRLIRSEIKVFSSQEILSEYQKVLRRDFEYSDEELMRIMETVMSFAELVKPTEKVKAVKDDPYDDKIIECAIASSSEYIITYDKHLLNLNGFRGIKIITPEIALKMFWQQP